MSYYQYWLSVLTPINGELQRLKKQMMRTLSVATKYNDVLYVLAY